MTDDSGRESREPAEPARPTPERLEVIARCYREAPLSWLEAFVRDLLAEATALRAERDAAYAQGALDMRTRAAAVASISDVAAVAAEIEALDVEVPR